MSVDIEQIVHDWHAEQPHPSNPSLKVGDYALAVKLATKTLFGGHASPEQAGAFWSEFKDMNARLLEQGKTAITPDEYGHLLDRVAPVSFALHGRPPTLSELARHRDAEPATVQKYYGDLPDRHYPHITASQMAKYLTLAEPFAQEHLGRHPVKLEAARFAMGGLNVADIGDYYRLASGQRDLRPNLQPPQPGDWGAVRPGYGPPETGISDRRRNPGQSPTGWERRGGEDRRQPDRAPDPSGPAESGGQGTGATE